jgi:undecaprenyl-diphosphatase
MNIFEAIILGIVEGITEFLPVSSTGHLTIVEKMMGFAINDPDITAFTAIIQIGAVLATVVYLRKDIVRVVGAWLSGLFSSNKRQDHDYRYGWAIIIGSMPIGIVGFFFKDQVETTLRSLWWVGISLIVWSAVMWAADRHTKQRRHEQGASLKDTIIIGLAQCLALVPGVSRSGATMSAGLLRGFDRVTVTKLSFFLAIPALLAAGIYESFSQFGTISSGVGWPSTIVASIVSFFVAYGVVAWLLKFVSNNDYSLFIYYRVALGVILVILLATNTITAT